MHLKRWLTAIVLTPILIFLIGPGPRWAFHIFLYLVSMVGLVEFFKLGGPHLPRFVRWSCYTLTLILFLVIHLRQILLAPIIIVLWAAVPMTYFMLNHPLPDKELSADIGKAVLGPIYVALPIALLQLIDILPHGNLWIFFVLSVIVANDTLAFYAGRLFGRHKLHEPISPGKTWEGAIGGVIGSVFAGALFVKIVHIHPLNMAILILSFALSVAGQTGDLVESMVKRAHGVKDSGRILPGHGGILDRIDGLIFAIPVLYLYISLWVI
ncbi:MAG: phosphatidate cytidylyltransferase [Pseudomonadota bacterium]